MFENLDHVFGASRKKAIEFKLDFIGSELLIFGLYKDQKLISFFNTLNKINLERWIEKIVVGYPKTIIEKEKDMPITIELEDICKLAVEYSIRDKANDINSIHLLLAMMSFNNNGSTVLSKEGVTFNNCINFFELSGQIAEGIKKVDCQVNRLSLLSRWSSALFAKFFPIKNYREKIIGKLYDISMKLSDQNQFHEAGTYLNIISFIQPNINIFHAKALYAYRKWENQKALAFIERAIEFEPKEVNVLIMKGVILIRLQKYNEALKVLLIANQLKANDAIILNNLGYCYIEMQDFHNAIEFLKKAISIDDFNAYAYNNLGLAYLKINNFSLAKKKIDYSLEIDKGNSYAYYVHAQLNFALQEIKQGCDNLKKAEEYGFFNEHGGQAKQLQQMYCNN